MKIITKKKSAKKNYILVQSNLSINNVSIINIVRIY